MSEIATLVDFTVQQKLTRIVASAGVALLVEFPELARELANLGVNLIVVPTSLMVPYAHVAHYLVLARTIENQIYVAYANRIGSEEVFALHLEIF